MRSASADPVDSLRRSARILLLLRGAQAAGIAPMHIVAFHGFAYLSNVLAPVWDMPAQEGRILKKQGGPFYPELQADLDRMVGRGMVGISQVSHVRTVDGKWRLDGHYSLNPDLATDAVEYLVGHPLERRYVAFVTELAYALSALRGGELQNALVEDATYADPAVGGNNVVDFAEWTQRNPSANAARYFERLATDAGGLPITPGEKLHLYVRHLHRRAQHAR